MVRVREPRQALCGVIAFTLMFQLFYLGAQPFAGHLVPQFYDRLAHLALFSTLTALLWIATGGRHSIALIAFIAAVGAIDELRQVQLPGRSADTFDFLTDCWGAFGTACALLLHGSRLPPTRAQKLPCAE
jgi:VanZ family protein